MSNSSLTPKAETPILTLKPSTFNALVPSLVKNLFYALLAGIIIYGIIYLLKRWGTLELSTLEILTWLISGITLLIITPLLINLLILHNTKYIFYPTYVVMEFELIFVKRHSTPYHQIVNITSKISLWDRLCKAGDITLHTAEDRLPDLVLKYIKDPETIEGDLYDMIQKQKHIDLPPHIPTPTPTP